jgi:putative oxidoreductase
MTTLVRPIPATRGKTVILWAATSVLAIFFILMGLPKVLGQTGWVARFRGWGYPEWFPVVVGLAEIAGAMLLMIPSLARLGAAVLATIMVGAVGTHVWHGELPRIVPPIVLLVLVTLVGRARGRRTR